MSDDRIETDAMQLFIERLKHNGVATMTVKDGNLFIFRREVIQAMLDAHPTKQEFTILVQVPTKGSMS